MSGTPAFSSPTPGTSVESIAQVGNVMVAGGSFTQVNGQAQSFLAAWGAPNGAVSNAVPPATTNGEVLAIEPRPDHTSFYAAGKFSAVSGVATHVALYSLTARRPVASFKVVTDGTINTMQLVGTHLLIGGYFAHVNGALRFGLASVNATTGALDNYLTVRLAGHHNYGVQNGKVAGQVGAISMAVSPDGSKLIVIGNFNTVYNDEFARTTAYARDQIVNLRLTTSVPTVDPNWNTLTYHPRCDGNAFDSYVSQVAWAPDGSYFVVVDAGGYSSSTFQACDSATRFNASQTGLNIPPVWVQFTGKDSLYSVAVTSAAVYVGGHQRWLNNPYGADAAANGAVPRAGIAALDPANGEPLAWNPGRQPRGHGTVAIYGTKTGVWFGSDTNCIGPGAGNSCTGPNTYPREELAFFPYAGGTAPAGNVVAPGTKIMKVGSTTTENAFNPANGAGGPTSVTIGGSVNWSQTRGAFSLNGRIYYGKSDGNFYYRTAGGGRFGAERLIDPYDDPIWDSVLTGSPTGSMNTFHGVKSSFYTDIPHITAMFYANRSIYYTIAGDPRLYRRAFSPGTQASPNAGQDTGGVVSPIRVTVVNTGGLMNFSNAGGMFLAGGRLWVSSRSSGALYGMSWSGTTVSSRPFLDTAARGTWSGLGVFVVG